MAEKDALKDFVFSKGAGKFLSFESGKAVKLRVLTTDPLVSVDNWGGTRFAFVVYNFTDERAQILNAGQTITKEIQKLHQDDEWGADIKKMDIKILAEGDGMERKYTVTPVPKATQLTNAQIKECMEIKLEDDIENGTRLSFYDREKFNKEHAGEGEDEGLPEPDEAEEEGEPIDLSEIPF